MSSPINPSCRHFPSFGGGFDVVVDGACVVLPCVDDSVVCGGLVVCCVVDPGAEVVPGLSAHPDTLSA